MNVDVIMIIILIVKFYMLYLNPSHYQNVDLMFV